MTRKFTTNCLLEIKNAATRIDVVCKLIKMGRRDFTPNGFEADKTKAILAFGDCFTLSKNKSRPPPTAERCTSVPIFLALAGMREDTHYMQLFVKYKSPRGSVSDLTQKKGRLFLSYREVMCPKYITDYYRLATAAEIIEHFESFKNENSNAI